MIKIYNYGEVPVEEILARPEFAGGVEDTVSEIIADVRKNGDEALFRYTEKFDRAKLTSLEVTKEEIDEAFKSVDDKFIEILKKAADNIRTFHEKQKRNSFIINEKQGTVMGQKILPVEKAGLYVPGGTAAYPSSVLMNCIPAAIAGVSEVIVVTPPTGGKVNPVILAAAVIGGADRIFSIGGAQAIAALAYGTQSIPRVYKIV